MQMIQNKIFMTIRRFQLYKRKHNTVPRCVSCGKHLLVGERIEPTNNSTKRKYLCSICLKKPIVVYQYPLRNYTKKNPLGKNDYVHEIASYTSQ